MSDSSYLSPQSLCDLLALLARDQHAFAPGSVEHEAVLWHLSYLSEHVMALGDLLECCVAQVLDVNTRASVGFLMQALGGVMGCLLSRLKCGFE